MSLYFWTAFGFVAFYAIGGDDIKAFVMFCVLLIIGSVENAIREVVRGEG